jgi:hypothetical protein
VIVGAEALAATPSGAGVDASGLDTWARGIEVSSDPTGWHMLRAQMSLPAVERHLRKLRRQAWEKVGEMRDARDMGP